MLTRLCRENAGVAPPEILRCTQKLLDRVLFCAFCEDRGLLPAETLKHAFEHRDPYNPHPVWHNFLGLFRAIDEGNAGLNIPAYNGGLFAPDPTLDGLQVPDEVCAHFKELGDYDYRPAREVADAAEGTAVRSVIDVDILGHIFEQSITDLERLRETLSSADFQSAVSPTSSRQSADDRAPRRLETRDTAGSKPALPAEPAKPGRRRKQEGAVYTPAFITRYLVEQALGGVVKQRFETLRRQHEAEPQPYPLVTCVAVSPYTVVGKTFPPCYYRRYRFNLMPNQIRSRTSASSLPDFFNGLVFGFDVGTGSIGYAVRKGAQFLDVTSG